MANTGGQGDKASFSDEQLIEIFKAIKKQEQEQLKSIDRVAKHKEEVDDKLQVKSLQDIADEAAAELQSRKNVLEELKKESSKATKEQIDSARKSAAEALKAYEEADKQLREAKEKSAFIMNAYEKNLYNNLSIEERADVEKRAMEEQKRKVKDAEEQLAWARAIGDTNTQYAEEELEAQNKALEVMQEKAEKIQKAKENFKSVVQGTGTYLQNKEEAAKEQAENSRKEEKEAYDRMIEAQEYGTEQEQEAAKKAYEQAQKKAKEDDANWKKSHNQQASMKAALEFMNKAVDTAVQNMNKWYTSINTRLSGTGKTFNDINDLVRKNLATNPFVKMTTVLDSINQLTQKGIVYDLETRGYLLAMKDEVVATFDATNGTLLRLIRLQQADTTAARMGMQVELTKFLNRMYADSSYLAENIAQSISDAMVEATSQMTNSQGLEFEWVVQKWLGSLVSLGLSSNAAQSIAQGLNWLSTGNVQQLTGNDQLNTLLAMSSAKGGQSYADILTRGLNAETTNELLKAMVTYLREIASNENQVVKSAYGNIFNMSVADLRAISNMTEADIKQIYSQREEMTMASAENYLFDQLSTVGDRVHLSQKIDNVIDNIIYTVGSNIADTSWTYGLYRLNRVIEQVGNKGMSIPFISAFGTGFDLNATIQQVVDFGLLGFGLVTSLGDIFGSLGNNGTITADRFQQMWNPKAFNTRGQNFAGLAGGLRQGLSQSTVVGNASSADMKESTLSEQAESAKETQAITGIGEEQDHEFDDLWNEDDPMCVRIVSSDDNPLKVANVMYSPRALIDLQKILPNIFKRSASPLTGTLSYTEETPFDMLFNGIENGGVPVKVTNDPITEPVPVSFGGGIGEIFFPMG